MFSDGARGIGDMRIWELINSDVTKKLFADKKWNNKLSVAETDRIYFDLVDRGFLE